MTHVRSTNLDHRPAAPTPVRQFARTTWACIMCLASWSLVVSLGVIAGGSFWIGSNLNHVLAGRRTALVNFCSCSEGGKYTMCSESCKG